MPTGACDESRNVLCATGMLRFAFTKD